MITVATAILVIVTICVLTYAFKKCTNNHGKYKFPNGPQGLPFIGNILGMIANPHLKLSKWADKYGKLYTIKLANRPALVVNNVKLLKELFSKFASTGKFKTDTFLLISRGPNGILNTEGKLALEQRTFCIQSLKIFGFNTSSLENLLMGEIRDAMAAFMANATGSGRVVPYAHLQRATSNVIWIFINGNKIKGAENDDLSGNVLLKLQINFAEWMQYTLKSGLCFAPWLKYIAPKWSGYVGFDKCCRDIHEFFEKVFSENKKTFVKDAAPRHIVDCYLQQLENMKNETGSSFCGEWGHVNSIASVSELFIAAVGTTTITLDWILLYLSWNADAQVKLGKEIEEIIGLEREPTLEDKSRMPYTEAVIVESFRCSSIIAFGVIHELLEDVHFSGYFLPKKMVLIPNLYHIHHDKQVWGDPENFRPERFLENNGGSPALMENVVPFQGGRRICPGEPLARDFIFLMVVSFFQKFSVKPDPAIKREKYFEADVGAALMAPQLGLLIEKRND